MRAKREQPAFHRATPSPPCLAPFALHPLVLRPQSLRTASTCRLQGCLGCEELGLEVSSREPGWKLTLMCPESSYHPSRPATPPRADSSGMIVLARKNPTLGETVEVVSEVVPREMDYDGVAGRIHDRCLAPAVPRAAPLSTPLRAPDFPANRTCDAGIAWQIGSPLSG